MAAPAAMDDAPPQLRLSEFQQRVVLWPDEVDLFLGGGRGGGKSFALAFLQVRHAEKYGRRAKMLFVRQNYRGMRDFEAIQDEVFRSVFGSVGYNHSEHFWTFPNGATLQNDQFEARSDYNKFHGKSFSFIVVDEAGEYADPTLLDLLQSCLRAPKPMVPRFVMSANPGGPGHSWLCKRHVFKASPWTPYYEPSTERTFLNCPSTYRDNENIDHADYLKRLKNSTQDDPEMGKAWIDADWSIARGAYFSAVLDEKRVLVESWDPGSLPRPVREVSSGLNDPRAAVWRQIRRMQAGEAWDLFLAHDYGSTSPSVTYVVGESPGAQGPDGRFYPRGSIVLLDELATVEPGSLSKGLGYTIPVLADAIKVLADRWGIKPEGVGDDSMFSFGGSSSGSYADEFRSNGVHFHRAKKGLRKPGWSVMKTMLQDAGKPDRPGLYVSRRCAYWWLTVPSLARDPRDPDDVDSRAADHAADACRYALRRDRREVRTGTVKGLS